MIKLTHLDRSRSERIIWLLEELELDYELDTFLRRPDLFGPDEMKATHVLGRAPVIEDQGIVLAESGAIVEYILALYGEGRLSVAPGQPNFARYLYWLHYAEGSLMLQLLREWSLDRMLPDPDNHPGMGRVREGTRAHLGMIEEALSTSPYRRRRVHRGGHHDGLPVHDLQPAYPAARPRALSRHPGLRGALGSPAGIPHRDRVRGLTPFSRRGIGAGSPRSGA